MHWTCNDARSRRAREWEINSRGKKQVHSELGRALDECWWCDWCPHFLLECVCQVVVSVTLWHQLGVQLLCQHHSYGLRPCQMFGFSPPLDGKLDYPSTWRLSFTALHRITLQRLGMTRVIRASLDTASHQTILHHGIIYRWFSEGVEVLLCLLVGQFEVLHLLARGGEHPFQLCAPFTQFFQLMENPCHAMEMWVWVCVCVLLGGGIGSSNHRLW